MSWYASYQARGAVCAVNIVSSVSDERAADEAAERATIQNEPLLPPLGTIARAARDAAECAMVAGLMQAARPTSEQPEHLKKGAYLP